MTIQKYFERFYNMTPYFAISEDEWSHVKTTYDKEDVRNELAKCLMSYDLPYAELTEDDAYDDLMKLKGTRWNQLLKEGEWFPRNDQQTNYHLNYKGKQQYFTRSNTGNKASNFFQQENRWSVDAATCKGPKNTWNDFQGMYVLTGSAYSLKLPKIGKSELRTMMGLRRYICSQFKPNVATAFYEMNNSKNILDFSMGWGDRLAGFYASTTSEHYVGLDPRKENHPYYNQQKGFYEKHSSFFENNKKTDFFKSPAEEFDFTPYIDYFDMVFTSPPYFGIERYGYDDTQSWVRYQYIDEWNKNFLHKTLENIIPAVKKGGIIAINIADIFASSGGKQKRLNTKGEKWLEICNPMNDFLTSKGLTYEGCIGMEMAQRPQTGRSGMIERTDEYIEEYKDKIFAEPIWIWKK
jgi:hypothetical protein